MTPRQPLNRFRLFGFLAMLALLPAGFTHAAEDPVAVFSQVYNGYTRTKLPDGSFKPEAYTFGMGGSWTRAVKDPEMEKMDFLRVARSIARPLASLDYVPALETGEAELLILVFWGSTQGTRDYDPSGSINRLSSAISVRAAAWDIDEASQLNPDNRDPGTSAADSSYDAALFQMAMDNRERDLLADRNARILGYTELMSRARFVSHMSFAQDIIGEVEDNRYYVVLQAYDFKTAVAEKKLKPMWTARISMPEHGNDFDQSLERMIRLAMPYIGQNSRGLRRDVTREGRVELGPLRVIEDEDAP